MAHTFQQILAEAAEAAIPATAEAMDCVAARLEALRLNWSEQTAGASVAELMELRRRLGQVQTLVEHAASRRLGMARYVQALESGYTATGLPPAPAPTSWECVG